MSKYREEKRLWQLLSPFRWAIVGAVLLAAGTILANVGLLAVSAVLISLAALQPPLLDLMVYIVGVRFFGISRAVLRYAERYVSHDITFRILSRLRTVIYDCMEPLPPEELQDYSQGELFGRLLADIETLKYFYLRAVIAPAAAVIVLLVCSLFLGQFSPVAVVLLAVMFLLFGVVLPWLLNRSSCKVSEKMMAQQEQWQNELIDYLGGLSVLHCLRQLDGWQEKLLLTLEQVEAKQSKLAGWEQLTTHLLQYGSNLAMGLAACLTIPAVAAGQLAGIYFSMVLLMVWASFEAIIPLPQALLQWQQSLVAAKRIFSLPVSREKEREQEVSLPHLDIVLEQVDFSYHGRRKDFYQQLNLYCPQGSHIVLVGHSGSGKSTLALLLLKFWQPDGGRICLGGIPLEQIPDEQLRRLITIVQQDTYLFHATLKENLLLAKADASQQELAAALEFAQLEKVVIDLPQGMDTMLGENGYRLSGGQRQRIALARLYLQDSPVIILDEAFQGLDYLTAEQLRNQLQQWAVGKTVIEITHSMHGLEKQDCIYLFEHGKIVEQGTALELLQQQGKFYQLWQLERQQW